MSCEQFLKALKKTELVQTEKLYDENQYSLKRMQIMELRNIEKNNRKAEIIKSKRALKIILKLDETDWAYSEVQG